MFALLADKSVSFLYYEQIVINICFRVPIKLNPSGGSSDHDGNDHVHSTNVGAIAGGVVAGVIVVAAIALAVSLFLRRRRVVNRDSFGYQAERIQAVKHVKPSGVSSEAILEPLDPMTQFPDTESQPASFPQPSQHMSSVSLLQTNGQFTPSPLSPGSPPASSVAPYFDLPPSNSAALEKQRLMMRALEDPGTFSSAPDAPVPSRVVAPPVEGSNPTHGSAVSSQNTSPDLRSELDDLRREVERIRQEREAAQEAPPLYDSVLEEDLRR